MPSTATITAADANFARKLALRCGFVQVSIVPLCCPDEVAVAAVVVTGKTGWRYSR